MSDNLGKIPTQYPIKCQVCEGDHLYRACPHRGERRTMQKIQEDDTIEDMGRSMPRIYAVLENKQVEFRCHMIEVEGKIKDQPIAILIVS
jgi:hypothetical protein